MNCDRHFHLRNQLRRTIATAVVAALCALIFLALWPLVHDLARVVVSLCFIAFALTLIGCVVMAIRLVHALERMDRENTELNPWRSRPRLSDDEDYPF